MIAILSIIIVAAGATFAWIAGQHPRHQQVMETCGGTLLIAGFALLGYGLRWAVGCF